MKKPLIRLLRNLSTPVYFILACLLSLGACRSDNKSEKSLESSSLKKGEVVTITRKEVTESENQTVSYSELSNSDPDIVDSKIDPNNIDLKVLEVLLHRTINQVRRNNRLASLKRNLVLIEAAKDQNQYVVQNEELTHNQKSSNKRTVQDRVKHYGGGFQITAENLIFEGFTVRTINGVQSEIITPTYHQIVQTMVRKWLNSPGHRANILNNEIDYVGTAIAYNSKNHAVYATQVFGKLW